MSTMKVQLENAKQDERHRVADVLESERVVQTIANYASTKEDAVRLIAYLLRTSSVNSALEPAAAPIHGRA